MNIKRLILPVAAIVLGLFFAATAVFASKDALITAVFSSVSNGYARVKLPDGSFKREYYVIANGQYSRGAVADPSIDGVKFPAIAGLVAQFLAQQNYFLADKAATADILLRISWGTTIPHDDGSYRSNLDGVLGAMNQVNRIEDPDINVMDRGAALSEAASLRSAATDALESGILKTQMFNDIRDRANEKNARLLGYMREINDRNNPTRFGGAGTAYDDLISDIENERYFVIVSAYDFRAATREKKLKLLWATRVSIAAQGSRFNETLPAMLANAARQFGQNSGSLIRRYQEGVVRLGDTKFLETVPGADEPAKPAPEK